MEWDVPIWDLGALEMLAAEAGASFHTLLRRRGEGDVELRSVALGRPPIVDELAALIRGALAPHGAGGRPAAADGDGPPAGRAPC